MSFHYQLSPIGTHLLLPHSSSVLYLLLIHRKALKPRPDSTSAVSQTLGSQACTAKPNIEHTELSEAFIFAEQERRIEQEIKRC